MATLYIDTETCGLHGLPVLIQYAYDEGEIVLYEPWREPVYKTLQLIEEFTNHDWVMFNAAFDTFMLIKLYTTLSLVADKDEEPRNMIDEIVECEDKARFIDLTLKPKSCLDLMLLARKGKYQSLMAREPIKIRRIPTQLSYYLAAELEKRVQLDDIYFARSKDRKGVGGRWKIKDVMDKETGKIVPGFKDVCLTFKASGALKNLARHAFNLPEPVLFREIEVGREWWPMELGYAPYAKAVYQAIDIDRRSGSKKGKLLSDSQRSRQGPWPVVIMQHIIHWSLNAEARKYASNDIYLTRRLHREHFNCVSGGDNDSTLACMVAACRWHGYAINLTKIAELKVAAQSKIGKTPTGPKQSRAYITAVMDEIDMIGLRGSTKRKVLEDMVNDPLWRREDGSLHPAAERAKEVLAARQAKKEIEIYDKLILAGRFHASFVVVGTLSSRMAGTDGLNPQGIKHDKYVREAFDLCDPLDSRRVLCGGDFKSFEVGLAATVFDDERLIADIQSGIKIHAVMAQELYPHYTYEEILKSDGNGSMYPEGDMYDTGKKCIFSKFYAGDEHTWHKKMGVPIEIGGPANRRLEQRYKGIKRAQDKVNQQFGALRQPGGIGTKVEWHEPKEYVESFLGFKRFFTLEIKIAKILFGLAENPPKEWSKLKGKVSRRIDRVQTVGGATRSALYGAAFSIVSSMIRAAGNHLIQSPGAEITKAVQRAIWDLQRVGVHGWVVQPFNVHDEVMCPTLLERALDVQRQVQTTINGYLERIPLLAIDWLGNIGNWAGKKG